MSDTHDDTDDTPTGDDGENPAEQGAETAQPHPAGDEDRNP